GLDDHLDRPPVAPVPEREPIEGRPSDGTERTEIAERQSEPPPDDERDGHGAEDGVTRVTARLEATDPEDQIRLVARERRQQPRQLDRILAPVAVEERHHVDRRIEGLDAGPARRAVSPTRLHDDAGARRARHRPGSVDRAVVHDEHLVDEPGGHGPDDRADGGLLVEGRDDDGYAGATTVVHALPTFGRSPAVARGHSSRTRWPRANGQYGSEASRAPRR